MKILIISLIIFFSGCSLKSNNLNNGSVNGCQNYPNFKGIVLDDEF